MEQFDFELKSRKSVDVSQTSLLSRHSRFSLFFTSAIELLVGSLFRARGTSSPSTVHFNFKSLFGKYFKSIFSIENSFKIESFVSDELFRFIWFDKLTTCYVVHYNVTKLISRFLLLSFSFQNFDSGLIRLFTFAVFKFNKGTTGTFVLSYLATFRL